MAYTTDAPATTADPEVQTNGDGEEDSSGSPVFLIAGISSGVAVIVILLVVAVFAYGQYQDKQARARVGPRRPPKFGPSFDYCEGYYGDDRPGRRQLNNIEGDYYDYIEDDEDGKDEVMRRGTETTSTIKTATSFQHKPYLVYYNCILPII